MEELERGRDEGKREDKGEIGEEEEKAEREEARRERKERGCEQGEQVSIIKNILVL